MALETKAQQTRMAQSTASKFEITRQVINFGDRVVAVRHVTFAACRQGHPLRLPGAGLLMAALAGLGYEAVLGSGLSTLATGGSTKLWLAFVVAGVAIFGLVYQKRALVIGLDDGSKITLPAGGNDFLERVLGCIGGALEADGEAPFHVAIDLQAQTIESLTVEGLVVPGAEDYQPVPPVQIQTDAGTQVAAGAQARRSPVHAAGGAANGLPLANHGRDLATHDRIGHPHNGYDRSVPQRNGHATRSDGLSSRNPPPDHGPPAGWVAPTSANVTSYAGPVAVNDPAARGPAHQAELRPVREPSNPLRDMDMLLDFVRRSDIQHKAALLELLAVTEDYLKGGPTLREDASAHWLSFSGYVHQYLTSIDGLVALTDRAGRPFAAL